MFTFPGQNFVDHVVFPNALNEDTYEIGNPYIFIIEQTKSYVNLRVSTVAAILHVLLINHRE